jgi:hypothetical protein
MYAGNLILLGSVALNISAAWMPLPFGILAAAHILLLVSANLRMAKTFSILAETAGLCRTRANVYWFAAQNGIFAVILLALNTNWRLL